VIDNPTDYLRIERYLAHFTVAQALRLALRRGLLDAVANGGQVSLDALARTLEADAGGLYLLCEVLRGACVLTGDTRAYSLDDEFRQALTYRDLLEAKLDFANLLAPDLIEHFQDYVDDFPGFMERSRVFELFRYDRCYESSPDNLALTRTWMRYTTALTRHEAPVCLHYHDFSRYTRMLDVGGNSGEFVRQLCKAHQGLHADVFDLPVVCEIGREHVAGTLESQRISFLPGDAVHDALPTGYDLVTFKSMLHDWPSEAVEIFLDRAVQAVRPGGTILIFERGLLDLGQASINFGLLPMLLFFRNFREPQLYEQMLRRRGFDEIHLETVMLDTPFFILSARRGQR
jgi:hypothetical protein